MFIQLRDYRNIIKFVNSCCIVIDKFRSGIYINQVNIKYRSHAVDRMLQRNITTTEVELILSDPDGTIKQSQDKYIYYKKLKARKDNLVAAVALMKSINDFEVLTVMINFEVQ